MGMRRRAREIALQMLYQLDLQPELDLETAQQRFYASFFPIPRASDEAVAGDELTPTGLGRGDETCQFAERLVCGVVEHLVEIDARIVRASRNWRLERMGRVDRNLLRLATYEMRFCSDIPSKVTINEAIEVAKRFGTHETPSFVNGILDRILEELDIPV